MPKKKAKEKKAPTHVRVPIEFMEMINEFADDVWRGRFAELPAKMVGHMNIGDGDGVKRTASCACSMRGMAHTILEGTDELIAKAKGTW